MTQMGDFAGNAAIAVTKGKDADGRHSVQRELLELIDRDLKRNNIDPYDPLPRAPSAPVLSDLAPITGNVLIPLGEMISRIGMNLRLLKPGL